MPSFRLEAQDQGGIRVPNGGRLSACYFYMHTGFQLGLVQIWIITSMVKAKKLKKVIHDTDNVLTRRSIYGAPNKKSLGTNVPGVGFD